MDGQTGKEKKDVGLKRDREKSGLDIKAHTLMHKDRERQTER
jgi:hypothetical protein